MPRLNQYKFGMWFNDFPNPYRDEIDKDAHGIRNKPARYDETIFRWCGMCAGMFEWKGEPFDDMPPYIAELWLQSAGFAAIVKHGDKLHFVSKINSAFSGTFTEYYLPSGVVVSAAYAPEIDGEYTFGKNAVLIRNDAQMQGIFPLIAPRAEMEVENNVSILCGLQNLRIINIIRAANDTIKTAAESFLKQIRFGRSGIITGGKMKTWSGDDTKMIENLPTGGVPNNYMLQFIETAQYIKGSLYNDLGLQSNFNMKRESLNDSEIAANNDTLRPYVDEMLECRKRAAEEINRVFGTNVSVDLAGAWKTRAEIAEKTAEQIENPEPEPEHEDDEPTEGGEPNENTE